MPERACIRGCREKPKTKHYADCPDFGNDSGMCPGCVEGEPRMAREGALICDPCFKRLRSHLHDAGDIVGHLRSRADPSKAGSIDRSNPTTRPELPAPVDADLIDASNDIAEMMRLWAMRVEGRPVPQRTRGLHAGAPADVAQEVVQGLADVVIEGLDQVANDADAIPDLCEAVLARHPERPIDDQNPPPWSIADALARWSLRDRARWAAAPCPRCDLMSVWVIPARHRGAPDRYECRTVDCEWMADSNDDGGLWRDLYASEPVEVRPHDPDLLTLAAAARLAGVTQGTVRSWGKRGLVEVVDGRYRRGSVEAKGKAA